MALFKFVSFIGAICMLVAVAPSSEALSFYTRLVGGLALMWGSFYFLLKEDETLYGSVCVIFAVLVQPIYSIPFTSGMWMVLSFLAAAYLTLAGLLCSKIEKAHAIEHAKIEAELEMYRKNEEKLKEHESGGAVHGQANRTSRVRHR